MRHGGVRQGDEVFDSYKWHDDVLPGCLTDDQLWGYCIRAGEEMTQEYWGGVKDPVLENLMRIGIFERTDRRDVCLNQSLPAIRHSTAIASRLLPRLTAVETKVWIQKSSLDDNY
jgi:hypothetical protein